MATGPSVWAHREAPGSFYIPVLPFHSLGSVLKNAAVLLYRAETCLFSLHELQPLEAFHVGGPTCVPSLTLALPQEGRCTREQALGTRKVSHFLETRTHKLTWEKSPEPLPLFRVLIFLACEQNKI